MLFFFCILHLLKYESRMCVVVQLKFLHCLNALDGGFECICYFSNRFYDSFNHFCIMSHFGSVLFLHPIKLCSPDRFDINNAAR